jgi:ATP-dependent Clp protease ATP-binding subunit ClpB
MGARPLRRTIQDLVVEPLANELIQGKLSEKDQIALGLAGGKLSFKRKGADKDG